MQEIARRHYGENQVCSHADYQTLDLDECAKFPFISGHFGMIFAEPLLADRYLFTFLREPTERVVSLYKYLSKQPAEQSELAAAARTQSLKEFLLQANKPKFSQHLWNAQAWQLHSGWGSRKAREQADANLLGDPRQIDPNALLDRARQNLRRFDYIGFVDSFESDIRNIFADLGAPKIKVLHSNASKVEIHQPDEETLALIEELTALDRVIFDEAKKLVSHRSGGTG